MRKLFNADNSPRYIKVWDNGGATLDRYTIQFTRANCFKFTGRAYFMGSSAEPRGMSYCNDVDAATFSMPDIEKSSFDKLPAAVQRVVVIEYVQCWNATLSEIPEVWWSIIYR